MKILALVLLVIATGCGAPNTKNTSTIIPPTIYAYGDSITAGNINDGYSYANMVSQALSMPLINKAAGGTTMFSSNQYALLMSDTWSPKDIVIFTPGLNDAGFGMDQTHIAQYTQDLTDILKRMSVMNVTVYIGTPIQPLDQVVYDNSIVALYAQINRTAVTQINSPHIKLIDFNVAYTPTVQTTISGNGDVHPNTAGYDLMTAYFLSNM